MAITYIDELVVVSLPQVMEHRGIVKVCQVRHILSFFVFRWVHLLERIFLEVFRLLSVYQFIFISYVDPFVSVYHCLFYNSRLVRCG